MKVKFNYHDEFIEEMRKGPPPSKIVRRSMRTRTTEFATISHLSMVATFVNGGGDLVMLEERCGQVWRYAEGLPNAATQEAQDRANRAMKAIEEAAIEAGLEVRAGVLDE